MQTCERIFISDGVGLDRQHVLPQGFLSVTPGAFPEASSWADPLSRTSRDRRRGHPFPTPADAAHASAFAWFECALSAFEETSKLAPQWQR